MSTIKITLEPHDDGTLHLPLPPELRHGKLKVTATVELVEQTAEDAKNAWLRYRAIGDRLAATSVPGRHR